MLMIKLFEKSTSKTLSALARKRRPTTTQTHMRPTAIGDTLALHFRLRKRRTRPINTAVQSSLLRRWGPGKMRRIWRSRTIGRGALTLTWEDWRRRPRQFFLLILQVIHRLAINHCIRLLLLLSTSRTRCRSNSKTKPLSRPHRHRWVLRSDTTKLTSCLLQQARPSHRQHTTRCP